MTTRKRQPFLEQRGRAPSLLWPTRQSKVNSQAEVNASGRIRHESFRRRLRPKRVGHLDSDVLLLRCRRVIP